MTTSDKGKVAIRIAVDAADVQGLIDAFKTGKLADLGITALQFPDDPGLSAQVGNETHVDRHRPKGKTELPNR
jgi:hypothetical protein